MKYSGKVDFFKKNAKSLLSPEAKKIISKLSTRKPINFTGQLVLAWAIIITSIWIAMIVNSIFLCILVVVIVATRQNILGLLVHEQTHCLGFKAGIGDKVTNFFAAYPLLILTVEGYSQAHLSHHKFFMSEKDQDLARKSGENWIFPMKLSRLLYLFVTDLLCVNIITLIKGKKLFGKSENFIRPYQSPAWVRPIYFLIVIALLTYTQSWGVFLFYWVLPLIIFQMIARWSAICEHLYIANAEVTECSPVIVSTWWEKLIFPNLNFTLHAYHHFYPGIPFSNLPKVHQIFLQENLVNQEHIFNGNISFLKFLIKNEAIQISALEDNLKNPILQNQLSSTVLSN